VAWEYVPEGRPEPVAQGDIFADVEYSIRLRGAWAEERGFVIVIAHDCEYTKAARQRERPLSIAPLVVIDDLPDGQATPTRANEMSRYWPLPEKEPLAVGLAVDFANIQPLIAEDLEAAQRVTSIDDDGQLALVARLLTFYGQRGFKALA
jgi:hypothetical protein